MTYNQEAIAERLGWCVMVGDDNIYFEVTSTAGEDFGFEVMMRGDTVEQVRSFADNFEPQDHANKWVQAKNEGKVKNGSLLGSIEDAWEIKNRLLSLAAAMESAK